MTILRLYLLGINEASWQALQSKMVTRYPLGTIQFETAFAHQERQGLVICLLSEVDEVDSAFLDQLCKEKHLLGWERVGTWNRTPPIAWPRRGRDRLKLE